jgi:hypothetical protein
MTVVYWPWIGLALDRVHDAGMAVPGARHPDTGGEVEVATAVLVVEVHTRTAGGENRGGLVEKGGQLRHRAAPS